MSSCASSQLGHDGQIPRVKGHEHGRFRSAMGAVLRFATTIRPIGFAAVVMLASVLGCASSTFSGSVYRGEGFAFRVPPPPASWKRIDVDGKALSFVDEDTGALVAASGRCKVDGEDVPLKSLMQHLFLQFTDREVVTEEVVPFDGREAIHAVVIAKLDGVPKQFDVWVMKKDGCVYDLYCIAEPSQFATVSRQFREFVQGFATVSVE